jgi:ribonuclease P protein component
MRRSVEGFTFYLGKRDAGPARLGMLVTRKHAVRATERNGVKRCIREAFRLEQESLGSLDVLVRPPLSARGSPALLAKLRILFATLNDR